MSLRALPWILAVGMFVIGTTSLSILGIGPELTRDLGLPASAAGWLVTAFAATFAIAAPVAQFVLAARLSQRALIVVGAALLALSLAWTALATTFGGLLAARILSALGGALIAPTSTALAISLVPVARRGAILAIVFGGFTLATVAGVPVATWLSLALGWRGAMGAIAIVAAAFFVLVLIVLPAQTSSQAATSTARIANRFHLGGLLCVTVCVLAAQFTLYALMGEMLSQRADVPDGWLPFAILLFGVMGVAGNSAAGILSGRIGPVRLVWISLALLAGGCAAVALNFGALWGALALATCAFAGTLFATPQQNRLVNATPAAKHGVVLALNSSANYVGIAAGSALASLIADSVGLDTLAPAALLILALAAAGNAALGERAA